MTQQIINVGAAPNDGTGDPTRTAFTKSNDNFTELYARAPAGGRLEYVSATALSFKPYNDDRIKINRVLYQVPSGGIAGLGKTGIFKEGVGGSSLTANTFYRVYAFDNGGTITADYSTTAHATSTTAGNVGVEIKSGDDTRSLIGIIMFGADSNFHNDPDIKFVRSWFNRSQQVSQAAVSGSTTSATMLAISTTANFILFTGEMVEVMLNGYAMVNTPGTLTLQGRVDTVGYTPTILATSAVANANCPVGLIGVSDVTLTEGFHLAQTYIATNAGTTSFFGNVVVRVG